MSIAVTSFGKTKDGKNINLFTMTNKAGASVRVMDFGATLVGIKVPDRNGVIKEVTLGFDTVDNYLGPQSGFFGACVGRYANRIAFGKFTINGVTYDVAKNNGPHHLHGGIEGFNRKMYSVKGVEACEGKDSVSFTYLSPDGEENYPGNLTMTVTYSWDDSCRLLIHYEGICDKDTIVNMTNHSWFNIDGEDKLVNDDLSVQIFADYITEVDDTLIPTGKLIDVTGTDYDLREPVVLKDKWAKLQGNPYIGKTHGYDHNFVINGTGMRLFAVNKSLNTGRVMKVYSDLPCMQLYTANGPAAAPGHDGRRYPAHNSVCFETQYAPDSPNRPEFASSLLKAGEKYDTTTVYEFSVE